MNLLDPTSPYNKRKLRAGRFDRLLVIGSVVLAWGLLLGAAGWCVYDTVINRMGW